MAADTDVALPLLADGTSFDELIDRDDRTISLRLFSDPEIYRLELERVFTRVWLVLAHESEVPNPGDYVSRWIGQDPVVITRDESGEIHVFLNVCAHRGMQVCRAEVGNSKTFRCPYHGWLYGLDGSLKGVPAEREIYRDPLPKDRLGLRKARVEVFAGMVWATWDERAPSLSDYLGDMKFYLETAWNRSDRGMEVVGPPQRWVIPANWKLAADQFAGDGYHVITLHRGGKELGLFGDLDDLKMVLYGVDVSTQGHGTRCLPTDWRATEYNYDSQGGGNGEANGELTARDKLRHVLPAGLTTAMLDQPERNLTPEQLRLLSDYPPIVGQVFPTGAWINMAQIGGDLKPAATISWRTWVPRGPGKMEVMYWCLVERDAPEAVKAATRRATTQIFTSSGLIEQDDAEAWHGVQRAIGGAMAQRQRSNYQGLLGERQPANWPGGGLLYEGASCDDQQWNWWLRYQDFMTNRAW